MELKKDTGFTRPVLTVVKSTNLLPVRNGSTNPEEKKKVNQKMNMPEERQGYIKVRKHDCL